MGTKLRSELSTKNPYYIPKYRRKELEYFSKQYGMWYRLVRYMDEMLSGVSTKKLSGIIDVKKYKSYFPTDYSEVLNIKMILEHNMNIVDKAINEVKEFALRDYIFCNVTKGASYDEMDTKFTMPCSKKYFYKCIHKYYFILSGLRG